MTEYFALTWAGTRDIILRAQTFLFSFEEIHKTQNKATPMTFPVRISRCRAQFVEMRIFGHDRIFGQVTSNMRHNNRSNYSVKFGALEQIGSYDTVEVVYTKLVNISLSPTKRYQ